jgi:hypothetical protein
MSAFRPDEIAYGEQAFIRIYPDHVVSWGLGGA